MFDTLQVETFWLKYLINKGEFWCLGMQSASMCKSKDCDILNRMQGVGYKWKTSMHSVPESSLLL